MFFLLNVIACCSSLVKNRIIFILFLHMVNYIFIKYSYLINHTYLLLLYNSLIVVGRSIKYFKELFFSLFLEISCKITLLSLSIN